MPPPSSSEVTGRMVQKSLIPDDGAAPSPSPAEQEPLCTRHFVDLCGRLDRLERLLVEACGRPEAGGAMKRGASGGGTGAHRRGLGPEAAEPIGEEKSGRAADVGADVEVYTTQAQEAAAEPALAPEEAKDDGTQGEASIAEDGRVDARGGEISTTTANHRSHNHHQSHHHHARRSFSHHREASESIYGGDSGLEVKGLQRAAVKLMQFKGGLYDVVMGVVILANAIVLGLEIQWNLDGDVPSELFVVENLFLIVFLVDLVIRMLANQRGYLRSGWFLLESLLVVIGVVSNWILAPISAASSGGYGKQPLIRLFMILRTLRLLRLLRALRVFEMFDSLWKLCSGLILSAKTVGCAFIVVFFFTYIFACFAVEVITQSELLRGNEDTKVIVETRFSSLVRAGVTLLAFANADSVSSFYEPLIMQNPMLAPFFAMVWMVITLSLMNLVTAVIVEEAIALSSQDAETKRAELKKKVRSLMPKIEKLFDEIDASGDGVLELAELDITSITIPPVLEGILDEERLIDLFEMLDDDGSGTVDKHEFSDGVITLTLQNVPIETTQTLHLLRVQHGLMEDVLGRLEELRVAGAAARGPMPGSQASERSNSKGDRGDTQRSGRQEAARRGGDAPVETWSAEFMPDSSFELEGFRGDEGPRGESVPI